MFSNVRFGRVTGTEIFHILLRSYWYVSSDETKNPMRPAMSVPERHDLTEEDVTRLIGMAWADDVPFEAIEQHYGVPEEEVVTLMRRRLKRSSWELWRERVSGRPTKHASRPTLSNATSRRPPGARPIDPAGALDDPPATDLPTKSTDGATDAPEWTGAWRVLAYDGETPDVPTYYGVTTDGWDVIAARADGTEVDPHPIVEARAGGITVQSGPDEATREDWRVAVVGDRVRVEALNGPHEGAVGIAERIDADPYERAARQAGA